MLEVLKIGKNAKHDRSFFVNRPNGHPAYLLILVKTPANFYVNHRWMETPKDIAVIFKNGQHHLYGPPENCPSDCAYIDDWMHIAPPVNILSEHFPFGVPVPLHNPDDFYTLFQLIHAEFYGASPHKNKSISYLTAALLSKIEDETNTKEYPAVYYEVASLREKIYQNPGFEWNIPDMAASLHISEGYLHAIYKQYFHTTCITDVIESRIQAACEILTSTGKTVEEVAEACGYHNTEHFIRQFKNKIGLSPTKYRKSVDEPLL